jgi:hypothetical protein
MASPCGLLQRYGNGNRYPIMLDVKSLITGHGPLLVSILALVASFVSILIANKSRHFAEKAHNETQRLKLFEKRTDILSEIDRQHARFGSLLTVIAEKLILFQNNPWLSERFPKESERLSQNFNVVEHLRSHYDEQRNIHALIKEGVDMASLESAMADIRRLSIHIEEDIRQEENDLNETKKLIEEKGP